MAARRGRHGIIPADPLRGELRIDSDARGVTLDGRCLELTPKEFDLLAFLAARPRRTYSRDQLLQEVWASSSAWQGAATVTEHIHRLRAKMKSDAGTSQRLVTVKGAGYRFEPGELPGGSSRDAHAGMQLSHNATVVFVGTTIRFASPAAVQLFGAAEPGDVVGRDVIDFVAPASMRALMAALASVTAGRWPRPAPMSILRRDGTSVLVDLASMSVQWEGEDATQVTMWEREGAATSLREVVTGIRTEVPDAVIITDPEHRIQSLNPAAEQLYGWREHEVVGKPILDVLPWMGDATDLEDARRQLQDDGRWHGEVEQRRRDGTRLRVMTSTTLLRDSQRQPAGLIFVNRPVARGLGSAGLVMSDDRATTENLDDEIRRGIRQGEFTVHYQPVVELEGSSCVGVEALARWQHPTRGLLLPCAFIAAAERSGMIVELGELVLNTACQQAQLWRREGHDLHLSVNVSARQLSDEHLAERIAGVMAATSTPAGRLWLEVTETALVMDIVGAQAALREIDDLGARISIDDFGTGWASLTYLREFPIRQLKIDGTFVRGLGTISSDAAIVRSIVSLGCELELEVIAEGVETDEQRSHLLRLGCRLGQGYLFGRPLPPEALDLHLGL